MNKSIQIVIHILFVLLCKISLGQNSMEEVVYLKNGSIIRGIIIEQIPNQSIKIQTNDRNVFVFKYDEIEKITKENVPADISNNKEKVTNFKSRGFINLTEINYCPGIGDIKVGTYIQKNEDNSLGFRTINGYQISEHLSLGLGIGFEKYKYLTLIPVTFDIRVTIIKGKVSPVFIANAGYAIDLNDTKGGVIINPQIGIKTYISKNIAYLFNIGLKLQSQEFSYFQNSYISGSTLKYTNSRFFQYFTISTGFAF